MRDELTNVTINYWRGPEDPLRTWKQFVPVFNWESEDENETDNKDSSENCPDNSRDFPLRLELLLVQVVTGGSPGTQERVLFAWRLYTPFCVASNHGVS